MNRLFLYIQLNKKFLEDWIFYELSIQIITNQYIDIQVESMYWKTDKKRK